MHLIEAEQQSPSWVELDTPEDLCVVLMANGTRWNHIGVWLADESGKSGVILHSAQDRNCVAQTLQSARHSGISRFAFYQYHGHSHPDQQPA
jgi:hypothetical protein